MELRTDRFKLKEVFPDKAKSYAQKLKRKTGELEFVRKGIPIDPKDIEIKEGERAAIRLITTPHLDRDNEILIPHGAILDDFRQAPSVLYAHDYRGLPIGSDQWIKHVREGILAKTVYAKHQFAEDVYQCVKDKHLNSNSVGFIPVDAVTPEDKKQFAQTQEILEKDYGILKDESAKAKNIYTKWIMLEHSDVPVASNTQSLNLAVSKGDLVIQSDRLKKDLEIEVIKDREIEIETDEKGEIETEIEIQTKPETTEQYHHIPVRDKNDFVSTSFRTIDISKEKGIKAIIGKLKSDPNGPTHVQKYLLDAKKWSIEEAQAWVRENKEFEYQEENIDDLTEKLNGDAETEIEIKENKEIRIELVDDIETPEFKEAENIEIETTQELDEKTKEYQKECEHEWHEITAKNEKYLKEYTCTKCGIRRILNNQMKSDLMEATDYIGLEFAIKDLTSQITELKEGRVLSAKNRTLVKNTIDILTELKGQLEELYEATEPPGREEGKSTGEREIVIEKDSKQDNLDERIAGAIERLLENDRLSKMMNDAIKEALDVSIKKKLGKVE